jgi:predicted RNase H-like nuclease (RuvC/YqgF family)
MTDQLKDKYQEKGLEKQIEKLKEELSRTQKAVLSQGKEMAAYKTLTEENLELKTKLQEIIDVYEALYHDHSSRVEISCLDSFLDSLEAILVEPEA